MADEITQPNTQKEPDRVEPPRDVGRPSEYTAQMLSKAWQYVHNYNKTGVGITEEVPTIAGLAIHLELHRKTLHEWAKDPEKKEFCDIYESVMSMQEQILLSRGLSGRFNSTITKLMLTKHNYADKVETDISTLGKSLNDLSAKDQAKLDALMGTKPLTPSAQESAGHEAPTKPNGKDVQK